MNRFRFKTLIALAAGAFALAACDPAGLPSSPVPAERPAKPTPKTGVQPPSEVSRALADYYARVEANYLAQGLLRTDGGGPDTPFTQRQLTENFIKIALYEEFSSVGGRMVARESESRLHRWESAVRMKTHFGNSVPLAQRSQDRSAVNAFAARLSRVTGVPISAGSTNPNFHVFILNEDERRTIGPRLREIIPDINYSAISAVQNLNRSTLCLVFARDPLNDGVYTQAVAIIRAEHPDLLRLSCIHEELAQGLGLSNDSPQARPSVFNDDEEFGLLTTHDELLLQMLYDRRMRPGMTVPQARPVAETIAAELLGGAS